MGRRERNKRETRARLTEVAFRLFVEHGYDGTTVEMIAAGAGVSARTFFRYFETKDGVLLEPGSRLVAAAAQRLADVPPNDRELPTVVEVITDLLGDEDFFGPVEVRVVSARSNPHLLGRAAVWRHRWAAELADGLAAADGREGPTFRERAVCNVALTLMGAVFDEWFRLGGRADLDALTHEAMVAVCRATGAAQQQPYDRLLPADHLAADTAPVSGKKCQAADTK